MPCLSCAHIATWNWRKRLIPQRQSAVIQAIYWCNEKISNSFKLIFTLDSCYNAVIAFIMAVTNVAFSDKITHCVCLFFSLQTTLIACNHVGNLYQKTLIVKYQRFFFVLRSITSWARCWCWCWCWVIVWCWNRWNAVAIQYVLNGVTPEFGENSTIRNFVE